MIVLAKVLLPQVFENMGMPDLRALVAERSTMSTYIRGESFELPHHSIGVLLEGFVRGQDAGELVTSPAALLPSRMDQSSRKSEMSGTQYFFPAVMVFFPICTLFLVPFSVSYMSRWVAVMNCYGLPFDLVEESLVLYVMFVDESQVPCIFY